MDDPIHSGHQSLTEEMLRALAPGLVVTGTDSYKISHSPLDDDSGRTVVFVDSRLDIVHPDSLMPPSRFDIDDTLLLLDRGLRDHHLPGGFFDRDDDLSLMLDAAMMGPREALRAIKRRVYTLDREMSEEMASPPMVLPARGRDGTPRSIKETRRSQRGGSRRKGSRR